MVEKHQTAIKAERSYNNTFKLVKYTFLMSFLFSKNKEGMI